MMNRLSIMQEGDWRDVQRMMRRYERELKRIRDATALDAHRLREIAASALAKPRRKPLPTGRKTG